MNTAMNWRLSPGNAEGKNGKEVFCKLADFVVVFLWTADTKGEIDFLNQSWWNYTGQPREKSPQRAWLDCLEPSDAEAYLERWGQAIKNKNPFQIEVRVRRYDGSLRWMLAAGYPWLEGATLKGYVGSCSDVTARKSIADSCFPEESLRQIKRLVDNSPAVLIRRRVDTGWPVEFVSESISQFGVTRDQMVFGDVDYASLIHADDLFHVEQEVRRRLDAGQERLQMEYRIVRPDGSFAWVDDRTVVEKDASGRVVFLQTVILDCTQRRQAEEQLKYLSLHDPLTGLFTRQYFEQEMTRLADGTPSSLGIILCDLDGMKLVNDSLGHQSGDELLVAAAQTIKGCFSNGTTVARVGGDEFAVLLPTNSVKTFEGYCRRIREKIAAYNDQNPTVPISLSTGFAVNSSASIDMMALFA